MNEQDILKIINRRQSLFTTDIQVHDDHLNKIVEKSRFLVLGGAGSIGQEVVKHIFKRNPLKLHVIDISENDLTELVRDIRSSFGYIIGDFQTFALDIGSLEYDAFIKDDGKYDYVFNLSALKHVRSEKDAYTLMRMIDVNILNTIKTIRQSIEHGVSKYFCVSTDKAANPVNMMGASKRIMEHFLWFYSKQIPISTARFANVAFSNGSLLYGFNKRIEKKQPIVAPNDVARYFITPEESGELCLVSGLLGENRNTFFPKGNEDFILTRLTDIAINYLKFKGLKPVFCSSEDEARSFFMEHKENNSWPCYFSPSDTTGEKEYEEFYTSDEALDLERFSSFGIINNEITVDENKLLEFIEDIVRLRNSGTWTKEGILSLFHELLPFFDHEEKDKYLDSKM